MVCGLHGVHTTVSYTQHLTYYCFAVMLGYIPTYHTYRRASGYYPCIPRSSFWDVLDINNPSPTLAPGERVTK